jgi:hypothetical protein
LKLDLVAKWNDGWMGVKPDLKDCLALSKKDTNFEITFYYANLF